MVIEYPNIEGNGEIYLDVMRAICGDTAGKSMVDLMCYKAPYTPLLGFDERVYIDIQDRPLDYPEEQCNFFKGSVLSPWENMFHKFDVSICSDGIEHLSFFDGIYLLKKMDLNSNKQILFTPLGPLNETVDENPDSHRSHWSPQFINGLIENHYAYIVFPDFHKSMNTGAFFFWYCKNIKEDFERVKSILQNKKWAHGT